MSLQCIDLTFIQLLKLEINRLLDQGILQKVLIELFMKLNDISIDLLELPVIAHLIALSILNHLDVLQFQRHNQCFLLGILLHQGLVSLGKFWLDSWRISHIF
jgi:hypothetical protein